MARYKPYERYKDSGVEWIGEIPEHWGVSKVKEHWKVIRGRFTHRPRNDPKLYDGRYPFLQTGDISTGEKVITNYTQTLNELGYAVSREFLENTIMMSIAANIGDVAILGINACFPDSIVGIIPFDRIPELYTYYLFTAAKKEFNAIAVTNTQANLNTQRISNLFVPVPSSQEQITIAYFLDQKTSEIDGLVADKEKLVSRLQEYRQAIISEAVTKGLNPDVKMKDSGVEWIGDIPEHWEMCRLKRVTELVIQKASNDDLDKPYIGLENIESWTGKYNTVEYFEDTSANLFSPGMVLFGKLRPYLAKSIKVDFWGRCSSELITLKPNKITSHFLHYLLLTEGFISEVNSSTYGVKMPRASWGFIGNMSMSVPPESEQQAIADFLDRKTSEIDDLISGIQESIDQLKFYRQSLISEAVTGKIDVRGVI